ncbi:MAG: hypothetical protein ACR2H1_03465, partial [Limisphaerales bacterium]
ELMFIDDYPYPRVESIVVQSDSKFLVGGYFTNANGSSIARFNADGTLDSSFNSGTGANGVVSSVTMQSDGRVLIGGYFTVVSGTNRNRIARLNANGSLDSSFNPGTGMNAGVDSIVVQSDGKALIGGAFTTVNGTNRNRLARLNVDGSFDNSFNPGAGVERAVFSLVVQPDGKVLVGKEWTEIAGLFTQPVSVFTFVNGTNRYGSARLNADGSLDSTFISANSFRPNLAAFFHSEDCADDPRYRCDQSAVPVALQPQSDGKVLIGGYVQTSISGDEVFLQSQRYFLARFNADGTSDPGFNPTQGSYSVASIAVQPDGKVIIGGEFNLANGTNRGGIVRLNADGSLDNSFNAVGVGGVSSVALQPDGKVLIGGWFTTVEGVNRSGIARLNANGSLDGSFNPGTGVGGPLERNLTVVVQSEGKVLIGGNFTTINGTNRNRIARLNADGSLDSSFNPGTGADGIVRSIALQADGNVLIGGDFITLNGVLRPYAARLYGDSLASLPALNISRSNNFMIVSWPASALNFQLQENTADIATGDWRNVLATPTDNGTTKTVIVNPAAGNRFYRLRSP